MQHYEAYKERVVIRLTPTQKRLLQGLIDEHRWYCLSDVIRAAITEFIQRETSRSLPDFVFS